MYKEADKTEGCREKLGANNKLRAPEFYCALQELERCEQCLVEPGSTRHFLMGQKVLCNVL